MTPTDPERAFVDAADELYALPPAEFTAARNARAKAARADGDRDLAARIAALPRASAGAWLVNVLVREAAEDLEQVLRIGAELQAAQEDSDLERVRHLGSARRDLLAEVADRASERAEESGTRAGPGALEELQQTLQAAMVDDDAAAAVRTGRLVRALTADGWEPVDLTNAVAGPSRYPAARTRPGPRPRSERRAGEGDPGAEAERARQRAAAEQRAAEARDRARRARSAADDAAADAAEAEDQVRQQEEAARDLRSRLEELRTALREAEQRLTTAEETAAEARAAADRAARDADDAERAADDAALQPGAPLPEQDRVRRR